MVLQNRDQGSHTTRETGQLGLRLLKRIIVGGEERVPAETVPPTDAERVKVVRLDRLIGGWVRIWVDGVWERLHDACEGCEVVLGYDGWEVARDVDDGVDDGDGDGVVLDGVEDVDDGAACEVS
jgi:hypothetical protein